MWVGLTAEELLPSPKFQRYVAIVPGATIEELSVNTVVYPWQTVLAVNRATGVGFTKALSTIVSAHPPPVETIRVTGYVPAAGYICVGFCLVEVPPSPKAQFQVDIVPLLTVDLSVNGEGFPKQTGVVTNAATGTRLTTTGNVMVLWQPKLDVTVKITL